MGNRIVLQHQDSPKTQDKGECLAARDDVLNKLIFRYLTQASMSYRAGIPLATIFLCRTALEAGLRQRIAEKSTDKHKYKIWEEMKKLKDLKMWELIKVAEKKAIISKSEIKEFFTIDEIMKSIIPDPRHLLDKYIHADFPTIIEFLEVTRSDVSGEIGVESLVQENIFHVESSLDKIAVFVLTATTRLAERLYLPLMGEDCSSLD